MGMAAAAFPGDPRIPSQTPPPYKINQAQAQYPHHV